MKTRINNPGYLPVPTELHLEPGYTVLWEKINDTEFKLTLVPPAPGDPIPTVIYDPFAAIGYGYQHGLVDQPHLSTDEYMRELREAQGIESEEENAR